MSDRIILDKAEQLGHLLLARGQTIATAESCTGGLLAGAITDIPGSSAWFGMGLVTYSNDAKVQLLEVDQAVLDQYGAVSEQVVWMMAKGAQQKAKADWTAAISGVAGPDGGTAQKPVGTVWFGFCRPDGIAWTKCCCFAGDRTAVRQQSVDMALSELITAYEAV